MSLVQAFATTEFVLVCGDQRASLTNGIINENVPKVFKISPSIIIGITGGIEEIARFFENYIVIDEKNQKLVPEYNPELTLNQLLKLLNERFDTIERKTICNLNCVVAGWDGNNFVIYKFSDTNGLDIIKPCGNQMLYFSCGIEAHATSLEEMYAKYRPCDMKGLIQVFDAVLLKGITFDSTINKKRTYEYLQRNEYVGK